jgi:hypothetical protein
MDEESLDMIPHELQIRSPLQNRQFGFFAGPFLTIIVITLYSNHRLNKLFRIFVELSMGIPGIECACTIIDDNEKAVTVYEN